LQREAGKSRNRVPDRTLPPLTAGVSTIQFEQPAQASDGYILAIF